MGIVRGGRATPQKWQHGRSGSGLRVVELIWRADTLLAKDCLGAGTWGNLLEGQCPDLSDLSGGVEVVDPFVDRMFIMY